MGRPGRACRRRVVACRFRRWFRLGRVGPDLLWVAALHRAGPVAPPPGRAGAHREEVSPLSLHYTVERGLGASAAARSAEGAGRRLEERPARLCGAGVRKLSPPCRGGFGRLHFLRRVWPAAFWLHAKAYCVFDLTYSLTRVFA